MSRYRKYVLFGLAAIIVGALVWFSQRTAVDVDELLARAIESLTQGEVAAAVIDLKSAVAADPQHSQAREMLGTAYLQMGNAKGALKELERARELGATGAGVNIGLTKALLLTGKYDEAATEIAINGDMEVPDWLALRGLLDLAQERLEDARTTFRALLRRHPDHEEARRGLMQAELAAGNAELARAEVEHLLGQRADDFGLWIIKGELDLFDGDLESSRESFRQAVARAGNNPAARIGLARVLVDLGQFEDASIELDAISSSTSEDPRVNFLRARIADAGDDSNVALSHLKKVLQLAPMHRESLVMAARIHFRLGQFTRAQDYVGRLLELEPANEAALRMMGAIQLASGRADGLENPAVRPASSAASEDPGMLALLGTAYLKHGRLDDGQESLARAVELAPDSLPIRTQLAVSRISSGDFEQAISELEGIVAEDPEFIQARIMLAMAFMANNSLDSARDTAAAVVEAHGDRGISFNLLGYVLEMSGDLDGARANYERAVQREADFHPARVNLARLAVAAGDLEGGAARFDEILAKAPFHAFALMGKAALALQSDDIDEAERLWLLAREHNPDAVAPRLLLAKHYRARGNTPLAQTVVEEAYKLAPYAPQVQEEYTLVMMETGEFEHALTTAQILVARSPKSAAAFELLARVQNQLGDESGLTSTLASITELAPEAAGARVLLGRLAIRQEDFDSARRQIDQLLGNAESAGFGHELAGDLKLAQDERDAALSDYQKAHELMPRTETVLKLDALVRSMGRQSNLLSDWLKEHPADVKVRLVRATQLHTEGTGSQAITEYEHMLEAQGENPIVLNNLAWLYHEAGDKRSIELAQRAYALAPQSPEIMDTYGWILVNSERQEQGLELLNKARDAAPNNPDIVYHAASAINDAGDRKQAQSLLRGILEEHESFSLRADAEALYEELTATD